MYKTGYCYTLKNARPLVPWVTGPLHCRVCRGSSYALGPS